SDPGCRGRKDVSSMKGVGCPVRYLDRSRLDEAVLEYGRAHQAVVRTDEDIVPASHGEGAARRPDARIDHAKKDRPLGKPLVGAEEHPSPFAHVLRLDVVG